MTTETTDAPEGVADPIDAILDEARQDTQPADDAGADTVEGGEGEQPEAKPKKTAQERIDEVTKARRDAERERDYWREQAISATPKPEAAPVKQDVEDKAPDPNDATRYPYGEADTGYIADLVDFRVRQGLAQHTQQQAVRQQADTVEQAWADRQTQFAKTTPDYSAVLGREWVCSEIMASAIRSSDDGPAVAYHLASNPDEAARINALPPIAQVRELGKIEASLAKPASQPVKTVSDAPDPAPQVRGAGGKFKAAPDTDDFASFDSAYD